MMTKLFSIVATAFLLSQVGCSAESKMTGGPAPLDEPKELPASAKIAYFAAGCFWCSEEIFQQQPGVISVTSGFMGGTEPNPTYEQVSEGNTNYAESVQVAYDPAKTSYEKLVETFWHAHDPTQLNRQGPDAGRQYRSAIFYTDDEQRDIAEKSKAAVTKAGTFSKPIATEITKAGKFYPAEEYHQNFYRKHPDHPYLQQWLLPKLKKLGLKYYVPEGMAAR